MAAWPPQGSGCLLPGRQPDPSPQWSHRRPFIGLPCPEGGLVAVVDQMPHARAFSLTISRFPRHVAVFYIPDFEISALASQAIDIRTTRDSTAIVVAICASDFERAEAPLSLTALVKCIFESEFTLGVAAFPISATPAAQQDNENEAALTPWEDENLSDMQVPHGNLYYSEHVFQVYHGAALLGNLKIGITLRIRIESLLFGPPA